MNDQPIWRESLDALPEFMSLLIATAGGPLLAVQPKRLTFLLDARLHRVHKAHGPPLNPSLA